MNDFELYLLIYENIWRHIYFRPISIFQNIICLEPMNSPNKAYVLVTQRVTIHPLTQNIISVLWMVFVLCIFICRVWVDNAKKHFKTYIHTLNWTLLYKISQTPVAKSIVLIYGT